jgi:peptide/nickel transport system permease protein
MAVSASNRAWERLKRSRSAWVSGATVVVLVVLAVIGPRLLIDSNDNTISNSVFTRPWTETWLGTDELGRSVLTQLIYGVRTSLIVGLSAAVAATVVGILMGAIAGYAGGKIDTLLMRVTEIFQVMPTFILASVIVALAGPGTARVIAVISLLSWPQMARLMRGEVLRVKNLEFVDAARCLGQSERQILWFEVVPNSLAPAFALSTLIIGNAILLESGLAFFGLTTPDIASWGRMLNSGQRFYYQAWWLAVFPGIAIMVTVLAFNLFGDALRNALSPRTKEGGGS